MPKNTPPVEEKAPDDGLLARILRETPVPRVPTPPITLTPHASPLANAIRRLNGEVEVLSSVVASMEEALRSYLSPSSAAGDTWPSVEDGAKAPDHIDNAADRISVIARHLSRLTDRIDP